jgi:hypothetical protein
MFDLPLFPTVLPISTILFNFLFLLVAIPVEGYILNARLKFDKKTSIFYALAINLFSNIVGWLVFFAIEPFLGEYLKSELLSFVFFNRFFSDIQRFLIIITFIIFFGTFVVKYLLLRLFLFSMIERGKPGSESEQLPRRYSRRAYSNKWQSTNLVTTVLIANSLSYSLIAIILFVRSLNI